MSQFRLLARTRQVTEYSCGACALQAVTSYWGKNVDERELMKVLRTTSEEGTYPENIVRGAQALGFEAGARDHLTLDEVEQFTAGGARVIALVQAWRSEKGEADSAAEEWDNGHYIVVLGVDKDYVYFEDPYARMSKAFMPRYICGSLASGDGRRPEEKSKAHAARHLRARKERGTPPTRHEDEPRGTGLREIRFLEPDGDEIPSRDSAV